MIIALSVGYAIWADSDRRPDADLRARLTGPLLVTCVGFSVWLAAAELEPIWTTLVIFLIMLAALLRALMLATDQRQAIRAWSPLARFLLWGTLGLYCGWSSVAVWLNLTTALVGSGAPVTTLAALVGQAAILAGAVGTAAAITWLSNGLLSLSSRLRKPRSRRRSAAAFSAPSQRRPPQRRVGRLRPFLRGLRAIVFST